MNSPSFPNESALADARFRALEKQLERMRGMHYGYYCQFFQAAHLFTAITLILFLISLHPAFQAAVYLIPFFIVYAGFFCAYLLCYNLFARIYATELEKQLNARLGGDYLIAHRMEDAYFYRTPGPKFVAIDLGNPGTCIGAITISYTFGGGVLYLLAAYRGWQLLPTLAAHFPPLHLFLPLLALWTLGHLAYLLWFCVGQKPERTLARILDEGYADLP